MAIDLLSGIQSLGIGQSLTVEDIDLDDSMRWNELDGGFLAFSVAPVFDDFGGIVLDGGEIFVLDLSTLTAQFLFHGGHLWDTDFDVMNTFGLANENINAIEAVPAPSTFVLLALAGLATRKRHHSCQ